MTGELLLEHAGESLQLEVKTTKKFLLSTETTDLLLPIIIPAVFNTQVRITASVSYDIEGKERTNLPVHKFRYVNPSCENRFPVNSDRFTYQIPAKSRIVGLENKLVQESQYNQIAVTHTDDSIIASGWMEVANCFTIHIPFVGTTHRLQDPAIYDHDITPISESPTIENRLKTVASDPKALIVPETVVTVSLPKEKSDNSTFWFEVSFISKDHEVKVYASPKVTTGDEEKLIAGEAGGMSIDGRYNPTLVAGASEAYVTLKLPQCGW